MNKIINIDSNILRYKNILAIPSIHSRVYFSLAVREAVKEFKPDAIAIEHPESFNKSLREAVSRLPFISLIIREIDNEAVYIPIDPCDSIIEAIRLAIDEEIPFFTVDKDITSINSNSHYLMPDDYLLNKIGLEKFYKEVKSKYSFFKTEMDKEREIFMAYKLNELSKNYQKILFVVGMSHWENIASILKKNDFSKINNEYQNNEENINIYNIYKDSLNKAIGEFPFTTYMYELFREGKLDNFDKINIIETIFKEAKLRYKLPISLLQQKNMMKYLRNLCLLENYIMPDYIDMLTASKCMVNNDYGLEVMQGMEYYPYYKEEEDYPTIKLNRDPATNGIEGLLKDKKIKLHKYDNVWRTSFKKIKIDKRPKEKYDGEWEEAWNNRTNLLSHIPEDVLMERNMNILRDKIKNMLTEDKAKIEPFRVSIKDGIDMRETIRNYYKNEIYVKEIPKLKGNIGHIVIIFDDEHDEDYNWNIVWYSEAHDDSDLILYATESGNILVGPGISKCYFGGYASLMPPQAPYDIWRDYNKLKEEGIIKNYADLLLYAAIIYSVDKYLGYVAPKPPSNILKEIAKNYSVEIVHIPLANFSSETLRKLRHFHVLGNRRLRSIAKDYII
ncbi:conjugal transfer protein TraB [Brachyspira aalborgi]|uniref:Conjugal transfer protein TraB n=1 Tax=Brachyspira aalborgi TaxID=29522 RepID=A0A5C8ED72_9SPIR|nr:conjugal transfer protein TraB [Brachyspira aalborgi]TXJ35685.1 conjugal transfer protein TraB [Brachyspira aalborgi]